MIHIFSYYTIVGPKSVRPNSEYHVTLSAHGLSEPLQVKVFLNGSEDSGGTFLKSQDVFLEPNSLKTVTFEVNNILLLITFIIILHNIRIFLIHSWVI